MEMIKFSLKELIKFKTVEEREEYYYKYLDLAKRREMAQIPINLHNLCESEMSLRRDEDVKGKKNVIDFFELRKKIRKIEVEYSYEYAKLRDEIIIYDVSVNSEILANIHRQEYDVIHESQYEIRLSTVIAEITQEHTTIIKMANQVALERRELFNLNDYKIQMQNGGENFSRLSQPVEELALPMERGPERVDIRPQHSEDVVEAQAEKDDIIEWLDNQAQTTMVIADTDSHVKVGKGLKTPVCVWAFPETVPAGYVMVRAEGVPLFITTRDRYIYEQSDYGEVLVGRLGVEDMDRGSYMMTTTLQLIDVFEHKGEDVRQKPYSERREICSSLKHLYPHLNGIQQQVRNVIWISPGAATMMFRTCGGICGFAVYKKTGQDRYEIVRQECKDQQLYLAVYGGSLRFIIKICKKVFDMTGFLTVLAEKVLWFRDKCRFKLAMEDLGYEENEIEAIWE